MFDLYFQFSWIGLVIFMLPMLINVLFFIKSAPEAEDKNETTRTIKVWEMVEQVTRILYCIAICILMNKHEIRIASPWLYIGIVFLILYYIVWIRYFANGLKVEYLTKSFLKIPIPLAVFPVLYYICAALWVQNPIAAVIMVVFGIAHNVVSHSS